MFTWACRRGRGWRVGSVILATACTASTGEDGPWRLTEVAAIPASGVRMLVLHDMEGLAGQAEPSSFDFGTPAYPHGQELLAGDLNAVIDGLFAGGAASVDVVDGHGSGNPDPDVRADLLDPRARQVIRDEPFDAYFDLVEPDAYDAVAVVGMHAKTGSGGFASHTFTLGIELIVNGHAITETELVALSWGREHVPVIFSSGDDRLAADLVTMPWIEYVMVKTALSADSAVPRPLAEARADLRAAAERAVRNLREAKVMHVTVPIRAGLRAVPPADLEYLRDVPGVEFEDGAVWFDADSLRAMYDGFGALVGAATLPYARVLREVLRDDSAGPGILVRWNDVLTRRWFDQESGRLPPPTLTTAPPRRYHGYR